MPKAATPDFQATVIGPEAAGPAANGLGAVIDRVVFLKQLQEVSNRIHSTDNLEEWQVGMAADICDLVRADRMTLYEVDATGKEIISRVKTGLNIKDIRLPVDGRSIAGYCAASRQVLSISDAYDAEELKRIDPSVRFLRNVDSFTGYQSRQMLVLPIVAGDQLLGVVQFINFKGGSPFPQLVVDGARELVKTLAVAMSRRRQKVGAVARTPFDDLIALGSLKPEAYTAAQRSARESGRELQALLIEQRAVSAAQMGEALARFFNVNYEPFKTNRIKPTELLKNLRLEFAESNRWVPLEEGPDGIVIVCTDPDRVRTSRMVGNIFPRKRVVYRVTTEPEFQQTLKEFFGAIGSMGSVDELLSDMNEGAESAEAAIDEVSAAADNELVRLVNRVIVEAHQQGASDIHIEPRPGKAKTIIRLRRDGALMKYIEVPASFRSALVTRIKIMCDLDISEKRKPQDGKIKFRKFGPLDIELRVATLPTAGGTEDVVMRILSSGEPLPLDSIDLSARNHQALLTCVEKPYGLFLVCGPTGSGKTTTLHSVLKHLNRADTKIWTAEDPVEITQDGLRQVQVNRKAGLDFVAVMRAFLRADPDIIMVGEMRDSETAGTGIEASLTGHLVMSTLHTNSAVESIIRLLDMGMDPFNFADALLGILAQRLARRLCKDCKEAYEPSREEIGRLMDEYSVELAHTTAWKADAGKARSQALHQWEQSFVKDGRYTIYRAKGCEACANTGYRGRVGLHELLVASDAVKALIQEKAKVPAILSAALGEGMRTLKMDGIEKVLQGITDLQQVRAVCIK